MKKHILLIEDEEAIIENLKALLEIRGYRVSGAGDGQKGMELARQTKPDLIILDLMLPRLTGFDVCQLLQMEESLKNVPILVLTSLGTMKEIEQAFAAGATDYMIKPFDTRRLLEKVEKLLR